MKNVMVLSIVFLFFLTIKSFPYYFNGYDGGYIEFFNNETELKIEYPKLKSAMNNFISNSYLIKKNVKFCGFNFYQTEYLLDSLSGFSMITIRSKTMKFKDKIELLEQFAKSTKYKAMYKATDIDLTGKHIYMLYEEKTGYWITITINDKNVEIIFSLKH